MDCFSSSLSTTMTTTTTTAFFASITFSKHMLCAPNIGRVSSRGTSLRGVGLSSMSFAKCENLLAGGSLSGQAFPRYCHRDNYWSSSSIPQHLNDCSIDLGSCNHALLTGYWVGPDTDDGWGFVEAWISPNS